MNYVSGSRLFDWRLLRASSIMNSPFCRPWPETWPPHRTCIFSRQMAEENARYLESAFGSAWIHKAVARNDRHPLIDLWRQGGDHAYLTLNVLADDLRTVEGVPGLPALVRALRAPREYAGQNFTLHAAALFRRAGIGLSRFFSPSNETVPDFELDLAGSTVSCEAKLLTRSQAEADFSTRASTLQREVIEGLPDGSVHPEIRIVLKDSLHLPSATELLPCLVDMPSMSGAEVAVYKRPEFNIYLVRGAHQGQVADFKSIQILAPASPKENDRVENLFKKANRQLRGKGDPSVAGVMCLGLDRHQDHRHIVNWASRKFMDNQFTSISALLMHRPAQLEGPGPAAPLELIGVLYNPNAREAVGQLNVSGVGVAESLDLTPDNSVSCYGVAMAQARMPGGSASFGINPVFRLAQDEIP